MKKLYFIFFVFFSVFLKGSSAITITINSTSTLNYENKGNSNLKTWEYQTNTFQSCLNSGCSNITKFCLYNYAYPTPSVPIVTWFEDSFNTSEYIGYSASVVFTMMSTYYGPLITGSGPYTFNPSSLPTCNFTVSLNNGTSLTTLASYSTNPDRTTANCGIQTFSTPFIINSSITTFRWSLNEIYQYSNFLQGNQDFIDACCFGFNQANGQTCVGANTTTNTDTSGAIVQIVITTTDQVTTAIQTTQQQTTAIQTTQQQTTAIQTTQQQTTAIQTTILQTTQLLTTVTNASFITTDMVSSNLKFLSALPGGVETIAGIIVAVILLCLVLIIISICLIKRNHRKKKKEKEQNHKSDVENDSSIPLKDMPRQEKEKDNNSLDSPKVASTTQNPNSSPYAVPQSTGNASNYSIPVELTSQKGNDLYGVITPSINSVSMLSSRDHSSTWEIDFKEIELGKELGSGAYGIVYKGEWRGLIVAVKRMATENEKEIQSFQEEFKVMKTLRPHTNIVQTLGVCTQPLAIVTEFIAGGSLYDLLHNYQIQIPLRLGFKIIRGITAGMVHLEAEGIVHRDLAARNVLLTKDYEAKISDFGMSRALGGVSAKKTNTDVGPIKWMAPECLVSQIYSTKSDVWAWGVTIVEILSRQDPYPTLDAIQTVIFVREGNRMPIPDVAGPEIVNLIRASWKELPQERPTFAEILKQLQAIKTKFP